jgi:hypothetical protein
MKTLFFAFTFLLMSFHAQALTCASSISVTSAGFDENFNQIQAALAAGMQRQQLLDAEITFGPFGLGAGRSKLSLDLVDGKIVNISINTNVKMAGINFGQMEHKLNITDFSSGRQLSFTIEGADHPALVITPGTGFTSRGGRVSIKTWTGKLNSQGRPIYSEPTLLYIGSDTQNRYSLYRAPSPNAQQAQTMQPRNRVTGLKINMRGNPFNVESLYAHNYQVKTQGG